MDSRAGTIALVAVLIVCGIVIFAIGWFLGMSGT